MTVVMFARHTGQLSRIATRFAQPSQKRTFPKGTMAKPPRGATRKSQQSASVAAASAAAGSGAVHVVVVGAVDWVSSSSLSPSRSKITLIKYVYVR